MKKHLTISILFIITTSFVFAQKYKKSIIADIDAKKDHYAKIAKELWENPELGYLEDKSSALLQTELKAEGFAIENGVADIPTAFTATYGSGSPVIGILGEFDALPGMSQEAEPKMKARIDGAPGQACGHHLFGTGSMAAAIAAKNWLKRTGKSGTIRFYGTPAEEGGSGKVYMVRAGLFKDIDAIVSWHPGDANASNPGTNLATISGKFRFKGNSSHAAAAPELGRSALDGVEGMNDLVNMLREHTTESTRIHYAITKGGDAPNIVPAEAEVYYIVRHANREEVKAVWDRVIKAAEGAAIGTETTMTYEIIGGTYDRLPNEALASLMHANMTLVGGVDYSTEELNFAEEIQKTLKVIKLLTSANMIQPMEFTYGKASADTGDVSWNAPLEPIDVPPAATACQLCGGVPGTQVAALTAAKGAFQLTSPVSADALP